MLTVIAFCFGAHAVLTLLARSEIRMFLGVLLFSHFYFCVAGYFYWVVYKDAYFVDAYWDPALVTRAVMYLSIATTLVGAVVHFGSGLVPVRSMAPIPKEILAAQPAPRIIQAMIGIGILSSLYVLRTGSFGDGFDSDNRPAFLLIAYQFSDMLIPVILYLVARRGFTTQTLALILYFVFYASLVGFRYKIALLMLPILVMLTMRPGTLWSKAATILPTGAAVLALFSLLTLFRSKFGVPDLTREIDNPYEELLYGLFAEANIMFAFALTLGAFVDRGVMFYFEPVIDIFKEWVPRFIMPDRVTGRYISLLNGSYMTDEGINSGTAYPFIGDFAMMFGEFGIWFGAVLYGFGFLLLRRAILKRALTADIRIMGVGLVIAMMAYYHYTRGYLPQAAKGYLFVVFPYIYLCHAELKALLPVSARLRKGGGTGGARMSAPTVA